ncbi:MAG: putative hemolysin-adenlyate cyclase protein [Phenylobacterium sp.]|nr:putative hemolysin-adenlyate cyclase protein [Phenylobacterium sp.]
MWRALTAMVLMAPSAGFSMERVGWQTAEPPLHVTAPSGDRDSLSADRRAQMRVRTLDQLSIHEQGAGRPWSITRSDGALCFEVRQGERRQKPIERDRPIERSEIMLREWLRFGADYTVHYEFMVAPGPSNTAGWVNIGQIHGNEDPQDSMDRGPLFAVKLVGERMLIVARTDPQRVTVARPADLRLYLDRSDLVRGRWYRMDVTTRIDPQGAGRLLVWRDGQELVNYAGPFGFNDAVGPYWKFGIYRSTSPGPLRVCYRGITLAEPVGALGAAR